MRTQTRRRRARAGLRWLAAAAGLVVLASSARADDWPQWDGPKRDGVWREKGILTKFPEKGPRVLWRSPVSTGFSGPSVVGDRVFVTDRQRAKDADGNPVPPKGGFAPGNERVLCLNAADGKVVWEHKYDCAYGRIGFPTGPRTTPLVESGKVYTFGTMGDLVCLDAAKGEVVWSKNVGKEYGAKTPVWGWSSSPLIDGDRLICLVGGKGSAVVAFDKKTGKEVWKALDAEEIGYSPPILVEAGGKRQLIAWLGESVNGLDPDKGEVYWTVKFASGIPPQQPALSIPPPRASGDRLVFSNFVSGTLMLKLDKDRPAAQELWRGKSQNPEKPDGLHTLMTPPVFKGGHVYGVCINGELRCLNADTGERVWETFQATDGQKSEYATLFMIENGDRHFVFTDKGDLLIAKLSPKGYEELGRAHLIDTSQNARGREVVWAAPAFANRCVFVRNDKEIVCVSLAAEG